jgi:hypothetical protein
MNAILLGAASLGALSVFFTHDPHAHMAQVTAAQSQTADRGSMTRTIEIDRKTGTQTGEISVIAFAD